MQREISTAWSVCCVCGFIKCTWKGCWCCRQESSERGRRNRAQKSAGPSEKRANEMEGRDWTRPQKSRGFLQRERVRRRRERDTNSMCVFFLCCRRWNFMQHCNLGRAARGVVCFSTGRGKEQRWWERITPLRVCVDGSGYMLIKALLHSCWAFDYIQRWGNNEWQLTKWAKALDM